MLVQNLHKESLLQIREIFPDGLVRQIKHLGEFIEIDLMARVVYDIVGNLSQCFNIAYLESLLDILLEDCLDQSFDVPTLVAQVLHLRESSIVYITEKGCLPLGIRLCGQP